MKLRNYVLAFALAGLASGTAQAIPYAGEFYTGATPTYDGFVGAPNLLTGFDVFSNGSVAIFRGGVQLNPVGTTLVVGDVVTTLYQGVVNAFNPGLPSPNLLFPGQAGTYQLTVAAQFTETVIAAGGGVAILQVNSGGDIGVFYDGCAGNPSTPGTCIATTANILTGTGYTDGVMVAHGAPDMFMSLLTIVNTNGTSLSGSSNIGGLVDSSQLANPGAALLRNQVGFNPAPYDFESTTTLQFGPNILPGFQTTSFFDGGLGCAIFCRRGVNSNFVMRGDANVDLSARGVPEPTSVALLGIALAGLGFSRRRHAA